MSGADKEEKAIWSSVDRKSGERIWQTHLTPQSDRTLKTIYAKPPAAIPIVFLPGIMGTNLRTRGKSDAVWRPPNGIVEKLSAVFTWMWRGPKTRQSMLDLRTVEVDPDGPIDVGDCGLSEALARERGWGTVMKSSYHPVLAVMQKTLNAIAQYEAGTPLATPHSGPALRGGWKASGMLDPAEFGEQLGAPALSEAELVKAAHYQFDVWCAGYNWLQSNRTSGEDVRDYIEHTVLAHYRGKGIPANKVILVTHSMGGLVGRSLTELHKYDKVLGVVNGVQPATGAPAFYHHARCGYEGAEQVVLGRNAGEVTAVIANAPGALELAPSLDYDNGMPWLFLHDSRTKKVTALPANKNPYEEIYTNPAWYGLVPEENSKYLDMSKTQAGNDKRAYSRQMLVQNINSVSNFHHGLARKYFSQTYVHYGAEAEFHSWQSINWLGDLGAIEEGSYRDDENGVYSRREMVPVELRNSVTYTKKGAELKPGLSLGGDGTVPWPSGVAPERAKVRASFCHGSGGEGEHNVVEGYDHQSSYLDPRAQSATLYSIIKIAQSADWHE